jgi:glycosyltransferase involved in cell wall biosynthesis
METDVSQTSCRAFVPGLITIGMSAYNGEDEVDAAIESILNQTCADFELLLIDAGSTDSTVDRCRRAAEQDHRIRFTARDVQTPWYTNARTHLSEARGEFFLWADADDLWSTNYLESLRAAIQSSGADAALGVLAFIDRSGFAMPEAMPHGRRFPYMGSTCRFVRVFGYCATPEASGKVNALYAMWRTEVLRGIDPWFEPGLIDNPRRDDDMFFMGRALAVARMAQVTDAILYRRRQGIDSASSDQQVDLASSTPPKPMFLASPALWHTYALPRAYGRGYLRVLSPRDRPAATVGLAFRSVVGFAGRVLRRVSS